MKSLCICFIFVFFTIPFDDASEAAWSSFKVSGAKRMGESNQKFRENNRFESVVELLLESLLIATDTPSLTAHMADTERRRQLGLALYRVPRPTGMQLRRLKRRRQN